MVRKQNDAGMSEVIHNRKAAIRNSVLYGVFLALTLWGLVTRSSALGYVLMGSLVAWAIGGVTANIRAIRHGFRLDD